MIDITLPIFFENKEEAELANLGIENYTPLEEKDVEMVNFFNIDNIAPYKKEGRTYTEISSGGEYYICKYLPSTVHDMIVESYSKLK